MLSPCAIVYQVALLSYPNVFCLGLKLYQTLKRCCWRLKRSHADERTLMETCVYYFLVQVGDAGGNSDVLVQALRSTGKLLELFVAGTQCFLLCVLKFTAVVIILHQYCNCLHPSG